jgi:hypothetical protein
LARWRYAGVKAEVTGISMKKAPVRFTLILSGEGPLDWADLENMAAVILGQAQAYARGEWDIRLDSTCLACVHRPGLIPCTQDACDESTLSQSQGEHKLI